MAQEYGAAQPLIDLARKYHDNFSKVLDMIPSFGTKPVADKNAESSTDSGKLPPEWEEANRKSIEQQKASERKPISKRKLGGKATRAKSGAKSKVAKRKSE